MHFNSVLFAANILILSAALMSKLNASANLAWQIAFEHPESAIAFTFQQMFAGSSSFLTYTSTSGGESLFVSLRDRLHSSSVGHVRTSFADSFDSSVIGLGVALRWIWHS